MNDRPLVAVLDYGEPVGQGRQWATQFHPEKSATNGLRLLEVFAATTA